MKLLLEYEFLYALTRNFFFWNVLQWIPELQHYAPGVPVVLVGTKLGKSESILLINISTFMPVYVLILHMIHGLGLVLRQNFR